MRLYDIQNEIEMARDREREVKIKKKSRNENRAGDCVNMYPLGEGKC